MLSRVCEEADASTIQVAALDALQRCAGLVARLGWRLTAKLDHQPGCSGRQQCGTRRGMMLPPHVLNDVDMERFERDRPVAADFHDVITGRKHIRVAHDEQRAVRWAGQQAHSGAQDQGTRALGAHQRTGHVKAIFW